MKGSLTETTFTFSGTKHEHSNATEQLDVQLCRMAEKTNMSLSWHPHVAIS